MARIAAREKYLIRKKNMKRNKKLSSLLHKHTKPEEDTNEFIRGSLNEKYVQIYLISLFAFGHMIFTIMEHVKESDNQRVNSRLLLRLLLMTTFD